jgi:hypothetical protein
MFEQEIDFVKKGEINGQRNKDKGGVREKGDN